MPLRAKLEDLVVPVRRAALHPETGLRVHGLELRQRDGTDVRPGRAGGRRRHRARGADDTTSDQGDIATGRETRISAHRGSTFLRRVSVYFTR